MKIARRLRAAWRLLKSASAINRKYLSYVLRHKYYVFQECLVLGVPIWIALLHDWDKFTPIQWSGYALSFYGPWKYKQRPKWLTDRYDAAWNDHQKRNKHHYQHWILIEDSGKVVPLEMPDVWRREMIADWIGAGKAIKGKDWQPGEVLRWYTANRDHIYLHSTTRAAVEHRIGFKSAQTATQSQVLKIGP